MNLIVFSHKECWRSKASPIGFATDGGFVFHMQAFSTIASKVTVVVPVVSERPIGEVLFERTNIEIVPLQLPGFIGWKRKLSMVWFFVSHMVSFARRIRQADAVHCPIPSDIGTIGMIMAHMLGKPLLVRHCGNWYVAATMAERFWKWYMEKYAGGKRIFLATGGGYQPPSAKNAAIEWIFSSSLTQAQLLANKDRLAIGQGDKTRLIIASRQIEEKGTGRVIQALALLPGRENYTLDVVGAGPDLEKFRKLAEDLGVQHLVNFHGKLSHNAVLACMKKADLFVYPTAASEGFPKVVLEAMSCGLPVVATPVSILGKLISEHDAGVVLKIGDAAETSDVISQLMTDKQKLQVYSLNANKAAASYSLEAWAEFIKTRMVKFWGADLVGTA